MCLGYSHLNCSPLGNYPLCYVKRAAKKNEAQLSDKFIFYMDDFGTRTTCKGATTVDSPVHEFSFALGGIIVASEDVEALSKNVRQFCERWSVPSLHGNKIRSAKGKFGFLKGDPAKKEQFYTELEALVVDDRLIAHACVICRPGYRDRYLEKYPDTNRWEMSKTAFDISVERAGKFALGQGRKLDVVFERTGAKEDRLLEVYFAELKSKGMGFCADKSQQYDPLSNATFSELLNIMWSDGKSNPMLQLADLVVHPVCHVTSGKHNRAYEQLCNKKMLLDFKDQDHTIGVKYSCFDGTYGFWREPQKHTRDPEGSPVAVGVKPDPVAKP